MTQITPFADQAAAILDELAPRAEERKDARQLLAIADRYRHLDHHGPATLLEGKARAYAFQAEDPFALLDVADQLLQRPFTTTQVVQVLADATGFANATNNTDALIAIADRHILMHVRAQPPVALPDGAPE